MAALVEAVTNPGNPLVVLTGPGGMGKSRLLISVDERLADLHPELTVRFLSTMGEPTVESLEALGAGPTLLIVDDAHDREGLAGLMHFAATLENRCTLLLSTRLYAEARLRQQA
ncbi:MAG TPA: hypothetical protein VFR21_25885, partial [Bradyrhizobium sp.]|nr:hypothetical protein [Bradyrhizobium sp.]